MSILTARSWCRCSVRVLTVRRPVVGAYARKLLDNLRAGTPKHLYLPGPHRGRVQSRRLEGQPEIILCEALLDALTFWAAGYRNVTSCYGVNGMTEELLGALKSCGAQRILIAFDRDEAGDRGAEAWRSGSPPKASTASGSCSRRAWTRMRMPAR
jgi:hypothetical protein